MGSQRAGHSSVRNILGYFQVLSFKNKACSKQKEKKKIKRIFKKPTFLSLERFPEFHHGAPTQATTLLEATTQRELGLTQETYKNTLPSCCLKMPRSPILAQTTPSLFPALAGVSSKPTGAC